jgi:hypothetical protein
VPRAFPEISVNTLLAIAAVSPLIFAGAKQPSQIINLNN